MNNFSIFIILGLVIIISMIMILLHHTFGASIAHWLEHAAHKLMK
ncbi:hypothetical protein Xinn_00656 [Xenorhabdus innexi]|uniref:Uncharacterized protein n=1 Tax=Xenorhabdus innexi TaxID=290109 RepID=A0A2G0NSX6_9GAMM|nr:hypothetical protein Xinn_00656 [Xenorhabdus innexi]